MSIDYSAGQLMKNNPEKKEILFRGLVIHEHGQNWLEGVPLLKHFRGFVKISNFISVIVDNHRGRQNGCKNLTPKIITEKYSNFCQKLSKFCLFPQFCIFSETNWKKFPQNYLPDLSPSHPLPVLMYDWIWHDITTELS